MLTELKVGLTTTYNGIVIEYLEDQNKWRFELRGRERKADSLMQVKEWIDKPEPVKKSTKAFKRFEALFAGGWSNSYKKEDRRIVQVTSAAQDMYRGSNVPNAAWILKNGERSKESVEKLFEISEANTEKWAQYDATMETVFRLTKQAETLIKSMKRIDLTVYLDGDENK